MGFPRFFGQLVRDQFSGTITVTPSLGGTVLKVIAYKTGWTDAIVHSATYYYESGNGAAVSDAGVNSANMAYPIGGGPVDGGPGGGGIWIDGGGQPTITYDDNGNLIHYKEWNYRYDAQNRLTEAWNGTTTAQFYYDGKNRQIARKIGGDIRFSSWDGWELLEEYGSGLSVAKGYLQGATGVIKSWDPIYGQLYYYQDKLGSTTHVANALGQLAESYHYDLTGTPSYFNSTSQPINSSTVGVADLYAGERWIPELGLYDLRNRFMSPQLGRFLQPDPIGFKGDASNLYRYCGNDYADHTDPSGLTMWGDLMKFFTGNPSMNVVLADWNAALIRRLTTAPASGSNNGQAQGASNSQQQNQPGIPDYAIRSVERAYPTKDGDTYYARVFWRIQLFHRKNGASVGKGVLVGEKIEWSNKVDFKGKDYIEGKFQTRDDGSVEDPWKLPFSSPDGKVTTTQTIFAGGRQLKWDATVTAKGEVDARQYGEFTDSPH